jgi:hypothetical protein
VGAGQYPCPSDRGTAPGGKGALATLLCQAWVGGVWVSQPWTCPTESSLARGCLPACTAGLLMPACSTAHSLISVVWAPWGDPCLHAAPHMVATNATASRGRASQGRLASLRTDRARAYKCVHVGGALYVCSSCRLGDACTHGLDLHWRLTHHSTWSPDLPHASSSDTVVTQQAPCGVHMSAAQALERLTLVVGRLL